MRAQLSGLVVLLVSAVLAALAVVPIASASGSNCIVINESTGATYNDLQSAVGAAYTDDTLLVQGTCTGTTTVSVDLTLAGRQPRGSSAPTLDGAGAGAVLTITHGIRVAVQALTITDGRTASSDLGGGITDDGGVLTVINSTITENNAMFGAGIENDQGKVVVKDSQITDNAATVDGGGIDTFPTGSVTVRGASSISDNTAGLNGGGIAHFGSGSLTLREISSVSHNSASNGGGGIYDAQTGTVALHDASTVYNNRAGGDGGGILDNNGRLRGVVAGSNVFGNAPDDVS